MTVAELIEALQDQDPDAEVRFAVQPSWPMQANPGSGYLAHDPAGEPVVYLAVGEPTGYLPGSVASELGWSR